MANLIAGRVTTILDAKNSDFHRKIKQSKADIKSFGKESEKTSKTVSTLFKGAAVAAFAVALGKALKTSVKLAATLEQTRVSFATMIGSRSGADQLITSLKEMARITPFTSGKLFSASKTLLAFGVASKDVTKTLKLLGDVSAGTGKDISEMAVIFGKIRSNGRLMGQELNQLVDAGFNPLQIISQKTGKSMRELKKDMSKGLITFDQVNDAFKTATSEGGQFFDLMNKQSETFNGKMSTLKDNFQTIGENIGDQLIGPLKVALDIANKLTGAIAKATKVRAGDAPAGKGDNLITVLFKGIKGGSVMGDFTNAWIKVIVAMGIAVPVIILTATSIGALALSIEALGLAAAGANVGILAGLVTGAFAGIVTAFKVGMGLIATVTGVTFAAIIASAAFLGFKILEFRKNLDKDEELSEDGKGPKAVTRNNFLDRAAGRWVDRLFAEADAVNNEAFNEGLRESARNVTQGREERNRFDIDVPLDAVLPTALEKLRMAIDELTLRFTREALNKKVDPMRTPSDLLEKAHGLQLINTITPFAAFEMLQQAVSNQMAFDPFGDGDDSKKSFKLAGAFAKGSVEANRVINQREENPNEKKVVDNTALTAELLGIMNNRGIKLQNVEVAN